MEIVIPMEGLSEMLTRIDDAQMFLKLYSNDVTPTRTTVLGDLTEATVDGYAAINIAGGAWDAPATSGNTVYLDRDPSGFAADPGESQDVYGWYLTNGTETEIIAVARFDSAPVSLDSVGFSVIPYLGLRSVYP